MLFKNAFCPSSAHWPWHCDDHGHCDERDWIFAGVEERQAGLGSAGKSNQNIRGKVAIATVLCDSMCRKWARQHRNEDKEKLKAFVQ